MKTLLKIVLLFLLNIPFYLNANAQKPITWQRVLSNAYGTLFKAHQTPDNNFIAVGSDSWGVGYKIYLTKWSYTGDSLWTRLIGITDDTDGYWIENTYDRGFIICGSKNRVAYFLKTDSMGNKLWDAFYSGSAVLNQAYCVKQTSDSGFIAVIRTIPNGNYDNILIVRLNQLGKLIWQKLFLAGNDQYAHEIIQIDESFYVIGSAYADIYLIKLNAFGDTLWTKRYGTSYPDAGYSVQLTQDEGFIIGGVSINSSNISKSLIVKTDFSGNLQWQRTYSVEHNELLYSVRAEPNRGYVFCGTTDSVFGNLERGFIRIIDYNGNVLNEKFYRALPYFTEIRSVENTNDNGFILGGVTQMLQGGQPKMYLAKTDSVGNIYPVNILQSNLEIPEKVQLFQNYPNPFNSDSKIKYEIKQKAHYKMKLYDVKGRLISVIIDETVSPGTYEKNLNTYFKDLSSSVYFISMENDKHVLTRKLLLLK